MTACAAGTGPAVERTDEGGVEIVMSHRPAWPEGEGWRLSAEPDLIIGENTDDLDYVFSSVRGLVTLPDGRIVAGDFAESEIRFFDADGSYLAKAGREGQGPGELGGIADVMLCGDGILYVLDAMRYEVNEVTFDGEFDRRDPFELNAGVSLLFPLFCNADGLLIAVDFGDQLRGERRTGSFRGWANVWLLDSQGFPLQDFGRFDSVELFEFQGRTNRHPFGKRLAFDLGDDVAYIGTADEFEIEAWSLDGELVRRIRRPFDDAAIAQQDFDLYVELEAMTRAGERLAEFEVRTANMPLPDTYPAYETFVLDRDANLWVMHFPRPGEEINTWSVFDPTGVWLGEVAIPARLWITEIGPGHILGVWRDELGDESIRRYPLSR